MDQAGVPDAGDTRDRTTRRNILKGTSIVVPSTTAGAAGNRPQCAVGNGRALRIRDDLVITAARVLWNSAL